MSQLPISDGTELGYEAPRNVQFSVFIDNRVGQLRELLSVFDRQALVVAGLSIIDSADYAVVRMITSKSDLARRLLQRHKHPFSENDILVVELASDQTLHKMCACLLQAELNIHHAYPLLVRPRGLPTIALHTDDLTMASQVLVRKLFTLLGENDLGENSSRNTSGPSPN
jgi:hypothetical protein